MKALYASVFSLMLVNLSKIKYSTFSYCYTDVVVLPKKQLAVFLWSTLNKIMIINMRQLLVL